MKPLLLGTAIALMATAAYAQNPAPAPETDATAPSSQAVPATPDMPAPAPSAAAFVPDQSWVGRYVYTSDGKDLGKIASVNGAGALIYFDTGGFLGLGATRKHVTVDQVQDVQSDRIVLKLLKADSDNLPADQS
jgi:PRC-barrel domain